MMRKSVVSWHQNVTQKHTPVLCLERSGVCGPSQAWLPVHADLELVGKPSSGWREEALSFLQRLTDLGTAWSPPWWQKEPKAGMEGETGLQAATPPNVGISLSWPLSRIPLLTKGAPLQNVFSEYVQWQSENTLLKKINPLAVSWQSSDYGSELSLLNDWVQSLVRELRSCNPCNMANKRTNKHHAC